MKDPNWYKQITEVRNINYVERKTLFFSFCKKNSETYISFTFLQKQISKYLLSIYYYYIFKILNAALMNQRQKKSELDFSLSKIYFYIY